MTTARRRAIVVGAATALAAATTMWAPPAHAACTTVPASTPGTTLRIAGEDHRVPAVSHVSVCTSGSSVPLVWVETSGGSCSAGCLSVGLEGDDADAGTVTISYRLDGTAHSETVDPGGVGGGNDTCLLSVGAPQAPRPTCFNAVNVELPVEDVEQLREDLEQQIADLQQDLGNLEQTACDTIPDQGEWGQADFCTDPQGWTREVARQVIMPILDMVEDLPPPGEILDEIFVCADVLEPLCS